MCFSNGEAERVRYILCKDAQQLPELILCRNLRQRGGGYICVLSDKKREKRPKVKRRGVGQGLCMYVLKSHITRININPGGEY